MFLMDVNVLFAAVNETHAAHPSVTRWLKTAPRHASCGLTQIGTFRLLLTPSPMRGSPLKPADVHDTIFRFINTAGHVFIACPAISRSIVGRTNGHHAAVDDYLVQIASDAGCKLATLDRALAARWSERTVLID